MGALILESGDVYVAVKLTSQVREKNALRGQKA